MLREGTYITEPVSQIPSGWIRRVYDKWLPKHIHALSRRGLYIHPSNDQLRTTEGVTHILEDGRSGCHISRACQAEYSLHGGVLGTL